MLKFWKKCMLNYILRSFLNFAIFPQEYEKTYLAIIRRKTISTQKNSDVKLEIWFCANPWEKIDLKYARKTALRTLMRKSAYVNQTFLGKIEHKRKFFIMINNQKSIWSIFKATKSLLNQRRIRLSL
jgi:hypothetical protein